VSQKFMREKAGNPRGGFAQTRGGVDSVERNQRAQIFLKSL